MATPSGGIPISCSGGRIGGAEDPPVEHPVPGDRRLLSRQQDERPRSLWAYLYKESEGRWSATRASPPGPVSSRLWELGSVACGKLEDSGWRHPEAFKRRARRRLI